MPMTANDPTHPIRIAREHANLTQKQLALKIGVSRSTIARAERGLGVDLLVLMRIARELGIAGRLRPSESDTLNVLPNGCIEVLSSGTILIGAAGETLRNGADGRADELLAVPRRSSTPAGSARAGVRPTTPGAA